MATLFATIEEHHNTVMWGLFAVIVFFAVACTLHDVIPVCHWIFQCDHRLH